MKSTLIVGIGASLLTAGIAKAQQRQDITPRTPDVLFIYADDWIWRLGMLRRHASENPEYQPARQERYPLHQRSRDRLYQYALPIFHANRRVRMAPPGNGHRRGKRRNDPTTGA